MSTQAPTYRLSTRELAALMGGAAKLAKLLAAVGLETNLAALAPAQARLLLERLGHPYAPRVLALVNLKGGVGKTTTAIHLATRAAQYGYRTCLLDLDSQASASIAFDQAPGDDQPIFYDLWQKPQKMLASALVPLAEDLSLLPSALENALLESALASPAAQKSAVAGVAQALLGLGYQLIICDCPPSLGTAVVSAICAADTVVVPMADDAFSFRGLELTLGEVEGICQTFGLPQPQVKVLLTRQDARLKLSGEAWQRLGQRHGDLLLPMPIRTSSEVAKALEQRRTLFASAKNSPARQDYDAFTRSLLGLDKILAPATPRPGGKA